MVIRFLRFAANFFAQKIVLAPIPGGPSRFQNLKGLVTIHTLFAIRTYYVGLGI